MTVAETAIWIIDHRGTGLKPSELTRATFTGAGSLGGDGHSSGSATNGTARTSATGASTVLHRHPGPPSPWQRLRWGTDGHPGRLDDEPGDSVAPGHGTTGRALGACPRALAAGASGTFLPGALGAGRGRITAW